MPFQSLKKCVKRFHVFYCCLKNLDPYSKYGWGFSRPSSKGTGTDPKQLISTDCKINTIFPKGMISCELDENFT